MCLIPYKGVGGRGLLYGFRPDSVTVGKKEVKKIILAISEGEFDLWKGNVKYDILLHQQMFEGEDNDGQEYDF
jgi:hypothetical protein